MGESGNYTNTDLTQTEGVPTPQADTGLPLEEFEFTATTTVRIRTVPGSALQAQLLTMVREGGGMPEHLARAQQGGIMNNNTYIADNAGNIAVGSEHFTQNATSGLDTGKLLELAAAIRQALPVLGLAPDQYADLEGQAAELDAAASAPQPEKGKLRALVDAILTGLTKAATPLATAIAAGLGDDAVRAITGH
jgi:hypothetical protein